MVSYGLISRNDEITHKLTMYITADGYWTSHRLHIGLVHEDLPRLAQ